MLCRYDRRTCDFLGRFYFYFSLVFYILGAFPLVGYYIGLLDIRDEYGQLGATRLVGYLPSRIQRALVVELLFIIHSLVSLKNEWKCHSLLKVSLAFFNQFNFQLFV